MKMRGQVVALQTIVVALCSVVDVSRGTNFPPVENPVPIPAPAVKAPLNTPPERFLMETNVDNQQNQRWFRGPFILQQNNPARPPYNPDFGGYGDDQQSEERSPVATPEPDDIAESSGTFPPFTTSRKSHNTAPVMLPSSNQWPSGKDISNQYIIQRWLPPSFPSSSVLSNMNVIKNPEISNQGARSPSISFGKGSSTITDINVNPAPPSVKQVWMNGARIYTSLQALLQDLPVPNQIKGVAMPSPPPPPPQFPPASISPQSKTAITQPMKNFPMPSSSVIFNKGSDQTNFNFPVSPKVIQIQNGKGASPATPFNLRDAAAANAWILNSNVVPAFVRQPGITSFKTSPGQPVSPEKGPRVVDSTKSSIPGASPKSNLNGGSWIIKQGEGPQYSEGVPLTFTPASTGKSKNLPSVISQSKFPKAMPPATGKSVNQGYIPSVPFISSIVFQRGNGNPKFSGPVSSTVGVIPHSPKSDVIVIGKGSTIAHLAPQKDIFLRGPLLASVASKPCLITTDSSAVPKDKSGVVYPQQFRVVSSPSKAMPAPTNRPSFYFIWNPTSQSNVLLVPQNVKQNAPSPAIKSAYPNAVTMPFVIPQNRFQYPLRYVRPSSVFNPVSDVTPGKYGGVRLINRGPITLPIPKDESQAEGGGGSPKENTEQESSDNKEDKKEELNQSESAESPASVKSSAESETKQIEKYEESPDNIPLPSEQKYSFLQAPKQMPNTSSEKPIIPYSFKYDQLDKSGTSHHREESSDPSGKITGNYGFKDKDGIYRNVDYVADNNGFRAKIHTNEKGIVSHNSADVNVVADPAPSKNDENTEKRILSGNFSWKQLSHL